MNSNRIANNRHYLRNILENKFLHRRQAGYDVLLSSCHSARYFNYDINKMISDKAVRDLDSIIKYCDRDKK